MKSVSKQSGITYLDLDSDDVPGSGAVDQTLVLQTHFRSLRVVSVLNSVAAADLLNCLEIATNSAWRRVGPTWVLAEHADLAPLCVSPRTERLNGLGQGQVEIARLSPRQWLTIRSRGWLGVDALSLSQRKALARFAAAKYLLGSELGPELRLLDDSYLKLSARTDLEDGPREVIEIFAPKRDGQLARHATVFKGPIPAEAIPEFYGRSPSTNISSLPSFPTDMGHGEEARLEDQPQLRVPIAGSAATALSAVERVGSATKTNVIFATRLHYFPVQASKGQIASETLALVSEATGGTWRRCGNLIVLQPNPALELAAKLTSDVRNSWRQQAAFAFQRDITGKRRKRLLEQKTLSVTELSDRQQSALRWIASLEFVSRAGLAPRALRLEGVELTLERPSSQDASRGARKAIRCRFPSRDGQPRELALIDLP